MSKGTGAKMAAAKKRGKQAAGVGAGIVSALVPNKFAEPILDENPRKTITGKKWQGG
jgi:hypothetical protein